VCLCPARRGPSAPRENLSAGPPRPRGHVSPRGGGADPFPPTRRRDEASRRKEPRQDKAGAKGVDKIEARKMRKDRKAGGVRPWNTQTYPRLCRRTPPIVILGQTERRGVRPGDPGLNIAASRHRGRRQHRFCTADTTSPPRHGFPKLTAPCGRS
jgi:hypothetical protein